MIKPLNANQLTLCLFFSLTSSIPALANPSLDSATSASTPVLIDKSVQTISALSASSTVADKAVTKTANLLAPTATPVAVDIDTDTDTDQFGYQLAQESAPLEHNWRWADQRRDDIQYRLNDWANKMNGWFGEPDPRDPASASLRVVLDTRWVDDAITGSDVTFEPRVRGRLKLPVLERRLSLIIGDEELDEETFLGPDATGKSYTAQASSQDKIVDTKKIRDDNASIALRWSRFGKKLGLDTDIDVGVRSLDDLFIKIDIDKDWYEGEKLRVSSDNFYRYGLDSKHYIRGGLSLQYGASVDRFINNRTTIRYRNQDEDETTDWSNDLRQVHYLGSDRRLDYGISTFGYLTGDKSTLNSYGPAISYRQPVWREWLFMQTELNYYNDKSEDKSHYPSALLRIEALF